MTSFSFAYSTRESHFCWENGTNEPRTAVRSAVSWHDDLANSFVSQSLTCKIFGNLTNPDLLLCAIHIALWASFCVAWLCLRNRGSNSAKTRPEPVVTLHEYTAPYSRSVLAFHALGFAAMYVGIIDAVLAGRAPSWFPGQRAVGTFAITAGAALLVWTVASFPSWRFRAKLDQGHALASGGAFGILRHPMYTGVNLIALGSAVWAPTAVTWSAFFLIVVGSELRARTEESVLRRAFGSRYTEYCKRTKRFVPGVY